MSALGKPGRPTRAEQAESDEFSIKLLHEYMLEGETLHTLSRRHGINPRSVWERTQRARKLQRIAERGSIV